ncbi:hypothetical protein LCGC14_2194020 [marine sediment metagenome]|uniref:TNase-like domain-containing protein n=1 Tax=marine sediment metagenome TaxID=412755 RepID=A0A0F9E5R1_9ZZZZ
MDSPSYCYSARVTKVVDTCVLQLVVDLGFHLTTEGRFRLLNVDTPELRPRRGTFDNLKCYETDEQKQLIIEAAKKARTFVIETVLEKDVTVKTEKADGFGRYLAEIWYVVDGKEICLNQELIDRGFAEPYNRR